jgi:hypothetical protein
VSADGGGRCRRAAGGAEAAREARCDTGEPGRPQGARVRRREAVGELVQHVHPGAKRRRAVELHAGALGHAAAVGGRAGAELGDEAGLPDTWLALDEEQAAVAGAGLLPGGV